MNSFEMTIFNYAEWLIAYLVHLRSLWVKRFQGMFHLFLSNETRITSDNIQDDNKKDLYFISVFLYFLGA